MMSIDVSGTRLTEQETGTYLEALHGLFSARDLNLYGDEPAEDSLPGRIRTPEFWRFSPGEQGPLSYSPALRHYLKTCLGRTCVLSFEEYLRIWVDSFYQTRRDIDSARDILLVFLHQNLELLRHWYLLSLPHNQFVETDDEALQVCFAAPDNRRWFAGCGFSDWVLQDWLPRHLRYYHGMIEPAETPAAHESEACAAL